MTTTIERAQALPTLYHQGKASGIYSWKVWTEGADIVTEYGLIDGEKQNARKTATHALPRMTSVLAWANR